MDSRLTVRRTSDRRLDAAPYGRMRDRARLGTASRSHRRSRSSAAAQMGRHIHVEHNHRAPVDLGDPNRPRGAGGRRRPAMNRTFMIKNKKEKKTSGGSSRISIRSRRAAATYWRSSKPSCPQTPRSHRAPHQLRSRNLPRPIQRRRRHHPQGWLLGRGDGDRPARYSGPEENTGSKTAMTLRIWLSRSGSHTSSRPSLRRHAAHLGCDDAP